MAMRYYYKALVWSCIAIYIIFILYETIICRVTSEDYQYNFTPFWSYFAIIRGEGVNLIQCNYLNIALFVPLGFLLGIVSERKQWSKVLLRLVLFSVVIEVLQLVFKRGFCEFDDVFHNAVGGAIGFYLCGMFAKIMFEHRRENI